MKNRNQIEFAGTYDYDKSSAELFARMGITFSINIFKWLLTTDGKHLKASKCVVRVKGLSAKKQETFDMADLVVNELNSNTWGGSKIVTVK